MSRRGSFLLFEGLAETVIDAQVLVQVRDLRRHGIADLAVWAVACSAADHARSRERLAGAQALAEGPVTVLRGVPPTLPGSARLNARLLSPHLVGPQRELIHARTDYAAEVALRLRPTTLIWDCRGDAQAEARARNAGRGLAGAILGARQAAAARHRVRRAAHACDRAIFVTRALRQRLVGGALDERSEIIPGAADDALFFFSPELRAATRAGLGWPDDARVLVYSGGLAAYQCWEDSVALFRRLRAERPELRLLVVTPRPEAARPALSGLPEESFRLRSARLEEVNAWLNAADHALLLRRRDALNEVAFPTKFAEYGMAGLPVLMSEALPEAFAIARELGNLCPVGDARVELLEGVDRAQVSAAYRERLSRAAVRDALRRVYDLP